MTASRRVAALEAGLDAPMAVIRWLDGAHATGSSGALLLAIVAGEVEPPLMVIPERVRAAARAAATDRSREGIARAERRATEDAVLHVELCIGLMATTTDLLREGWLRLDALRWELEVRLMDTDPSGRPDARLMASWRLRLGALRDGLAVQDAARRSLEARYLGGHPVPFPDTLVELERLTARLDRLAADGGLRPAAKLPDADVAAVANVLMERARAAAYTTLDRPADLRRVVGDLLQGRGEG